MLDESLSGLNSSLAHDVENNLLNHDDLTLLYITHKFDMALLKRYDEIIWIQDGKLYQMASLFNMTVEQNIVMYKKVDNNKLEKVLLDSGAKQFLTNENQLANQITSNGTNYSGGERQRIAIARGL
ncbi:ATP-binding cassette domain-containing protein|uniref:ATP-binding cassette domain-containing protein n=1 Tax=Leuconostoc lactis TaxID=1246 RepID=A0A6L7A7X1_LEULA|nr:ATP-binding cassette domain-containing protein [Leuconostoc lactis]